MDIRNTFKDHLVKLYYLWIRDAEFVPDDDTLSYARNNMMNFMDDVIYSNKEIEKMARILAEESVTGIVGVLKNYYENSDKVNG